MRDYSKGLIYKLVCKDLIIKECYYGSTTNFSKRKIKHKSVCNNINSKEYNAPKYQFIRVNGGWDNWEMILVKNYPCENKLELEREERLIMEQDNNRLNVELPTQSRKEYYDNNKEKIKKYYDNNKDKLKEYRDNNKDKRKDYYNNNKDNFKEYYEINKENILKKITCECGSKVCYINKARHLKSKKHKKYLEKLI